MNGEQICRFWSVLLVGYLIAFGDFHCAFAAADDPEPTVVINSSWSGNSAEKWCEHAKMWFDENRRLVDQIGCANVTSCPQLMPVYTACVVSISPEEEARNFEDRLTTAFAINPSCKGASMTRFSGQQLSPGTAEALKRPHWILMIDYKLGTDDQHWQLDTSETPILHTEGEGPAKKMAADICAIVLGHGGKLRP